jgi:hypothetical protein
MIVSVKVTMTGEELMRNGAMLTMRYLNMKEDWMMTKLEQLKLACDKANKAWDKALDAWLKANYKLVKANDARAKANGAHQTELNILSEED